MLNSEIVTKSQNYGDKNNNPQMKLKIDSINIAQISRQFSLPLTTKRIFKRTNLFVEEVVNGHE